MQLTASTRYSDDEYSTNFETVGRVTFEAEGKTWRIHNIKIEPNGLWVSVERQTKTGKDFARGHGRAFMLPDLPADVAQAIVAALAVNARSAGTSSPERTVAMQHFDDYRYTYCLNHEQDYYAKLPPRMQVEEIRVQRTHRDGGEAWDLAFTQHDLGGPTLKMVMFGDSWDVFAEVPELFERLRSDQPSSLEELRVILRNLGFIDITRR